jgi:GNAT superfamily N-acetyltransferase
LIQLGSHRFFTISIDVTFKMQETNTMTPNIRSITCQQTYAIRKAILWPNGPEHMIVIDEDGLPSTQHLGLYDGDLHFGVISLFTTDDGRMQFRKFALLEDYQNKGAGSKLLSHVIDLAKAQNISLLWCNARVDAAPFYQRFGFSFETESFFRSDIEYKIAYQNFSKT